jgi:transcriptional regulator with XRE-family HTH domain
MSPTQKNTIDKNYPEDAGTRTIGLPEDLRSRIKEKRMKLKITLRELASRVGVGAGVLNRIEAGAKHPTPSLLLRMLAELGFGEGEFSLVLNETPESWTARRLTSAYPRSEQLGPVLKRGRIVSGISIEELASRTGIGVPRLTDLENGHINPNPGLLVTLVRGWSLTASELHSLFDASRPSGNQFAEQFVATVLERQGFRVFTQECGYGIEVNIGGGWRINVLAQLQHGKNDDAK